MWCHNPLTLGSYTDLRPMWGVLVAVVVVLIVVGSCANDGGEDAQTTLPPPPPVPFTPRVAWRVAARRHRRVSLMSTLAGAGRSDAGPVRRPLGVSRCGPQREEVPRADSLAINL